MILAPIMDSKQVGGASGSSVFPTRTKTLDLSVLYKSTTERHGLVNAAITSKLLTCY